jgi:hypothetical protein
VLALGACLGGNATIVGASRNVIVAGLAERAGYPISFSIFLKYGVIWTCSYDSPVFGKKYFPTHSPRESLSYAVSGADFLARCRSTNRRCRVELSWRTIAALHTSLHALGGRDPG